MHGSYKGFAWYRRERCDAVASGARVHKADVTTKGSERDKISHRRKTDIPVTAIGAPGEITPLTQNPVEPAETGSVYLLDRDS